MAYYGIVIEDDSTGWHHEERFEASNSIEVADKLEESLYQILSSERGQWSLSSWSNEGGSGIDGAHENGRTFSIVSE